MLIGLRQGRILARPRFDQSRFAIPIVQLLMKDTITQCSTIVIVLKYIYTR